MTNAELDEIRAKEDAKAWHDLHKGDPQTVAAIDLCNRAKEEIDRVVDVLLQAAAEVDHTPETYRLSSLANDLEDLGVFVQQEVERMMKR